MNRNEIKERVIKIVAEEVDRAGGIEENHDLFDDLGCDSLDVVALVMAVEDEIGVEIDDDVMSSVSTLKSLIDAASDALSKR